MLMRTARIQVSGLICSIISACVLSSCGSQVKQADALVSESGTPVGMVVEYSSPIDKNTVDIESFQVPAWNIRSYFVSNSNPLKKIKGEKLSDGGRYVVIFLEPEAKTSLPDKLEIVTNNEVPKVEIRIKQVAPVTTLSGKVVKPWKKALKAKDYYIVDEGIAK